MREIRALFVLTFCGRRGRRGRAANPGHSLPAPRRRRGCRSSSEREPSSASGCGVLAARPARAPAPSPKPGASSSSLRFCLLLVLLLLLLLLLPPLNPVPMPASSSVCFFFSSFTALLQITVRSSAAAVPRRESSGASGLDDGSSFAALPVALPYVPGRPSTTTLVPHRRRGRSLRVALRVRLFPLPEVSLLPRVLSLSPSPPQILTCPSLFCFSFLRVFRARRSPVARENRFFETRRGGEAETRRPGLQADQVPSYALEASPLQLFLRRSPALQVVSVLLLLLLLPRGSPGGARDGGAETRTDAEGVGTTLS